MATFTYTKIMEMIFKHEGGYVDHPRDPGGATNMGITHKVLAAWRGVVPWNKLPKSEIRNMSKDEAAKIYRKNYWDKVKGDNLPAGIDCYVMDYTVNSGPHRAVIHLQEVLGVGQDGKVGPITLEACRKADAVKVIKKLHARRMRFLRGLSIWSTFGKGWTRRTEGTLALSLDLVKTQAKEPKLPPIGSKPTNLLEVLIKIIVALFRRN